jgi:hypothetical protein
MASKQADAAGRRPNWQPAAESSSATVSPLSVAATAVRETNYPAVGGRIGLAPNSLH